MTSAALVRRIAETVEIQTATILVRDSLLTDISLPTVCIFANGNCAAFKAGKDIICIQIRFIRRQKCTALPVVYRRFCSAGWKSHGDFLHCRCTLAVTEGDVCHDLAMTLP